MGKLNFSELHGMGGKKNFKDKLQPYNVVPMCDIVFRQTGNKSYTMNSENTGSRINTYK